jgi:exonuclease III
MPDPVEIEPADLPVVILDFPRISISAINCNSLNMSNVTKHSRIRKFYGIASLKSDVIFLSDLRMCNKAGQTDSRFISETFAINPHCSYSLHHHSQKNSRGVGILVKKSLNFLCLDTERDPSGEDNYILLKAEINGLTVILGSIYGPNNRDDNFFVNLSNSIERFGDFPVVIGGDWNATLSCLPVDDNPDVLNMRELPNLYHSRKISELCDKFSLADPFRLLYPERLDYSFAPWGNVRNNRSRLDFFLISKTIAESVADCIIKPAVQSKLFDHKAISVYFAKKKPASSRPNISDRILRDPDVEIVVKLANYECYIQSCANQAVRNNLLRLVGRGFSLLREAGPDPSLIEYSYAELLDVDARNRIMQDLRQVMLDLDEANIQELETNIEDDLFMEFLMNNIRNEVISYQSFVCKTIEKSEKNLIAKIKGLK